jgi:uncharacterized coiled-coil protein SlyX
LQRQAEREEAERRAARQRALIERLSQKLVERDRIGVELQKKLGGAEQDFRQLISIANEVAAAWPFAEGQLAPAALSPSSIARLIT